MQPRQMRDTSRPVWPSFTYSAAYPDCLAMTKSEGRWIDRIASEPFLLVDDVEQRFPGGEAAAVFDQHRLPLVAIGGAVDRHMRGDQHVRHAPERIVGRQRLRVGDIKTGTGEMTVAQG